MKITRNWVSQFLVGANCELTEFVNALESVGLEVEGVRDLRAFYSQFTIAHVLNCADHPSSDRLVVCNVDIDNEQRLQIVTGASNGRSVSQVVLAPVGSSIKGVTMTPRMIRGVESHGMLCSLDELELPGKCDGLWEVPGNFAAGTPLIKAFPELDDIVLDISITPNRSDCMSAYGIARCLASRGIGKLKNLDNATVQPTTNSAWQIKCETDACTAYDVLEIKNLENYPLPFWMQFYLHACGYSLHEAAVVDIANYICVSLGTPLHVYDADVVRLSPIRIRQAHDGEAFTDLGLNDRSLASSDCVISNADSILCLAGVIGSHSSMCTATTKSALIESAVFDPIVVSKAGRRLGIDSHSCKLFERGVDQAMVRIALKHARDLILEVCGGSPGDCVSVVSKPLTTRKASVSREDVLRLTGLHMGSSQLRKILGLIGCTDVQGEDSLVFTVPSWRHDLSTVGSVVEEVLRVHGYDKLEPSTLPLVLPCSSAYADGLKTLRRLLCARSYSEVITYSFGSAEVEGRYKSADDCVTIANPLTSEVAVLRPSILPNLLSVVARNYSKGTKNISVFELGPIFLSDLSQKLCVAGVRSGSTTEENLYKDSRPYDFFDVKKDVESLLLSAGLDSVQFRSGDLPSVFHPGKSAAVLYKESVIAHCGQLHPRLVADLGVDEVVLGFELFLDELAMHEIVPQAQCEFSNHQSVVRDFAFIVDASVASGAIVETIRNVELIKSAKVFDVFTDAAMAASGKKSVAVRVTLEASDLAEQEKCLIEIVQSQHNAVIRDGS